MAYTLICQHVFSKFLRESSRRFTIRYCLTNLCSNNLQSYKDLYKRLHCTCTIHMKQRKTGSTLADLSSSYSDGERWMERITNCDSVDEVLYLGKQKDLNGNQVSIALNIIQNISQKNKCNVATEELEHLYGVVTQDTSTLTGESLVKSICNLFKLGIISCKCTHASSSHDILNVLEAECRRRLLHLPVHDLATLVCHYELLASTSETKALVKEAAKIVELRWRELQSPLLLGRLMSAANNFAPSLTICLQDKTLQLMDQLSFGELVKLSEALSNNSIRSIPILRAISFGVVEYKDQWEIALLLRLLKSLCKLSFHHQFLYKDLAEFLKNKLPSCDSSLVGNIALSYATLRIQHADLLETIFTYTCENFDIITVNDLRNILFAFSQLNYTIQNLDLFQEKLSSKIETKGFNRTSPLMKTDIAFSLAVLQVCPHSLLEQVLSHKSTEKEDNSLWSSSQQKGVHQIKLLQLNSYVRLECQEYNGPFLSEVFLTFPEGFYLNATRLHQSVMKTLEVVVGGAQFYMSNVRLSAGYQLDAVVIFQKDAKPLAVNGHGAINRNFNFIPDIPENCTRVAILTWGPSNYLFASEQLIGRSLMTRRHIQALGFHVIEVSYQKWSSIRSNWERVSFMKQQITNVTQCCKIRNK